MRIPQHPGRRPETSSCQRPSISLARKETWTLGETPWSCSLQSLVSTATARVRGGPGHLIQPPTRSSWLHHCCGGFSVYQKVESDPHRYVLRPQLPICGEEHRFWGLSVLPSCTTSPLRTCPATPVRWGLHRYLPQGAVSPPVGLLLAAVRQPGSTGRELRGTLVTRKQLLKRLTALHCEHSNDRRRKRRQTGSWEMRKRRKRRTIK